MSHIANLCRYFFGSDPTLEISEPWLLALAVKLGADLISEHGPPSLVVLPRACRDAGVSMHTIAEVIAREGL
jgi:hypothetical protein